ncbi:hypothetical protein IEQ34_022633 [Dendrobium chrysotoxum]|uniref:Uncharacterized protein n=1 Tax=Dendrobium chrysotoxum TaxID=161865 RepID=A0AAV7FZJ8_DENCH|nr:hypothetical protein IEQ34_022633 [Dendrobium chrysotoxum]
MDKHLKLFEDIRTPLLKDRRNISLKTFVLNGEAEMWCRGQHHDRFGGIPSIQIKWDKFTHICFSISSYCRKNVINFYLGSKMLLGSFLFLRGLKIILY